MENSNTKRIINSMINSLSSYEAGELALSELQENISAQYPALEGKYNQEIGVDSENFTEDLELILYTLPERKQKKEAEKIVCNFKSLLLSYV